MVPQKDEDKDLETLEKEAQKDEDAENERDDAEERANLDTLPGERQGDEEAWDRRLGSSNAPEHQKSKGYYDKQVWTNVDQRLPTAADADQNGNVWLGIGDDQPYLERYSAVEGFQGRANHYWARTQDYTATKQSQKDGEEGRAAKEEEEGE